MCRGSWSVVLLLSRRSRQPDRSGGARPGDRRGRTLDRRPRQQRGTIARAPAVDHTDDLWSTVLQTNLTPRSSSHETSAGRWSSAAAARSSSPPRSSASRAASTSRATRRRSRDRRSSARALERVGTARCERQRDRARLHRDRQHAGPARRPRSVPRRSSTGSRPDAGGAERPGRRDRLPRSRGLAITSTASCCRWTEDGSADDGHRLSPWPRAARLDPVATIADPPTRRRSRPRSQQGAPRQSR